MLNIRKSIHPPHTTHIREFEPSDARGIVRLHTESAECFESMEINEEFIQEISRRIDFIFFVAEQGTGTGDIIGFAGMLFNKTVGRGELGPVCVDPKHKNGGVGTLLVNHTLNHLQKHGVSRVIVKVKTVNDTALGFFRHLDFTREGDFKAYTKKGEDVIQLVKFL